ncbi:MAG: DUF1579 domain-containing protein [Polaromonas sp.]|uniref:DUF1579 domain-containing protein n=1 Tax=Polaromonas sp. TaxID=1869339 RepID=UPI0032635B45
MQATPQKEHEWLKQLLGHWTTTGECEGAPGQAPVKSEGTEIVRSLGGLWVVCEGKADMPGGGPCEMLMTLGYDPEKKVYQGTWAGSMMTHMWIYRGTLDASGKVLTLDTEGPSFKDDGKTARYQDVITIKGPDERTLHSQSLQPDGSWKRFMTASYRRVKTTS